MPTPRSCPRRLRLTPPCRFLLVAYCLLSGAAQALAATPTLKIEVPTGALAQMPVVEGKARVTARLITDVATVTPGDTLRVGVLFDLDPGWHIDWHNPGDAGFATELDWQVGDATLAPLSWPVPETFRDSDGAVTYGYGHQTLLFTRATVSDSVGNELSLVVQARYLACNIICSPGQVTLRRTLPVARTAVPADESTAALFAHYQARVPVSAQAAGVHLEMRLSQTPIRPGDAFRAAVVADACDANHVCPALRAGPDAFKPDRLPGITLRPLAPKAHPSGAEGLTLMFAGHLADSDEDTATELRGVLLLERQGTPLKPIEFSAPLPMGDEGDPITASSDSLFAGPEESVTPPHPLPAPSRGAMSALKALVFALLGGLLLNLMPCVLPVLAIKVIGATQVGQFKRSEIVAHGAAYVLGVQSTLSALAFTVIGLKYLGTAVGWGFQFQEPWFVATVCCVLLLFALNCFGVFELYTGAAGLDAAVHAAHGMRRSFLDGVLAVVLATPCSAPFLGSAVAYALAQDAVLTWMIFLAIGAGLAAPYVMLTLTPGWVRLVPKPGPWMQHLKTTLGFGLLGTAVWLIWLIGRFAGVDAMARLLILLVGVAFAAWLYGRLSHRVVAHQWKVIALLVLLTGFIGYSSLSFQMQTPGVSADTLHFKPYTNAAVLAELAQGRAAFVDFTADWCLTCKYNEQHILHDPAVVEAFHQAHVTLFKADWTRSDEAIRKTLQSFGRAGVPMYLLYSCDNPTGPRLLPELLTVDQVLAAVHAIKAAP